MYTSSSVTMSCTVCGMPSANCGVPLDGMPTSNRETLHWIRDKLNNLKLTEEQIKEETKNTFGEHRGLYFPAKLQNRRGGFCDICQTSGKWMALNSMIIEKKSPHFLKLV